MSTTGQLSHYGEGTVIEKENGDLARVMDNGKEFVVPKDDPRYEKLKNEKLMQDSGIGRYLSNNTSSNTFLWDGMPGPSKSSGGGGGSSRSTSSSSNISSGYYNQVAKYEQEMQQKMAEMEKFKRQEEAAMRRAIQTGVNKMEGTRTDINQGYDDMARQLYIDRRRGERLVPQQLAALGYTGGLTESSNLNLQTTYQDLLSQGERARIREIANLDSEIANFRASGDMQIAQLATQFAQNAMNIFMQLQTQLLNEKRWQDEMAWNQRALEEQMAQQARLAAQQQRGNGLLSLLFGGSGGGSGSSNKSASGPSLNIPHPDDLPQNNSTGSGNNGSGSGSSGSGGGNGNNPTGANKKGILPYPD